MRGDGEPVRPGIGTPRPMSRTNQSAQQNGTRSAESIKASGHVHRANRPDTRLHPTTTPTLQITPCNAGAIHTRHCSRHVRFSVVGVRFTPESRRGSGRSRESVVDPPQTCGIQTFDRQIGQQADGIAMQCRDQDLNRLRQPILLPFSASCRCDLGKLGLRCLDLRGPQPGPTLMRQEVRS